MASLEAHLVKLRFLAEKIGPSVGDADPLLKETFQYETLRTCFNHIGELLALADPAKIDAAERRVLPDLERVFKELPKLPNHVRQSELGALMLDVQVNLAGVRDPEPVAPRKRRRTPA